MRLSEQIQNFFKKKFFQHKNTKQVKNKLTK